MTALRTTAKKSGKEVSDALNNAIKPGQAAKGISDISTNLSQLAKSAKVPEQQFKTTAKVISDSMSHVAKQVGMTDKEFASLNERMLRNQAMKTAETSLRNIAKSADLSKNEIKALAVQMGYSSKEAEKMAGNLNRTRQSTDQLSHSFRSLLGVVTAFVSVTAVTRNLKETVTLFANYEQQIFKLENQLKVTGRVGQTTTEDLVRMSKEIGMATLASQQGVREAQAILMSFRAVGTESFERILLVAQDVSTVMGGDIVAATKQMAVALEDPIAGLGRLTRTGTTFTKEQKELIKSLAEAGRMAEAQNEILKVMESQYGGTAKAAAQGLAGSLDLLSEVVYNLRVEIGKELAPRTKEYVESLAGWIDKNQELIGQKIDRYVESIVTAGRGVAPVFAAIGSGIATVIDGYSSLPDIIKNIGIVGVLVGGKIGFGVVSAISLVAGQLKKLTEEASSTTLATKAEAILKMQESKLDSLQKQYNKLAGKDKEIFGEKLQSDIQAVTVYISELRKMIAGVAPEADDMAEKIDAALRKAFDLSDVKIDLPVPKPVDLGAIKQYEIVISRISDEYNKLTLSAKEYEKLKLNQWYAEQAAIVGKNHKELNILYDAQMAVIESAEGLTDRHIQMAEGMEDARLRAKGLTDEIDRLSLAAEMSLKNIKIDDMLSDIFGDVDAAVRLIDEIAKATEHAANETLRMWKGVFDETQKMNANTIKAMMDHGIGEIENWGKAAIDIVENTFAQIAAMALQQKIILPIFAQVFSGTSIGNAAQSMLPPGGNTGVTGSLGGFGVFGGIPGSSFFDKSIPGTGRQVAGPPTAGGVYPKQGITLGQGLMAAYGGYQVYQGIDSGNWSQAASGGLKVASAVPGPHQPFTLAASVLLDLFGGMFGKEKPRRYELSGMWSPDYTDISGIRHFTGEQASGIANPLFEAADAAKMAIADIGGSLDGVFMNIHSRMRTNARVTYEIMDEMGKVVSEGWKADSMDELPWDTITLSVFESMIKAADWTGTQIEDRLHLIDFSSIDTAIADLGFISDFESAIKIYKSGIEEQKAAIEAAADMSGMISGLADFRESSSRLGFDMEAVVEAQKAYVESLVYGREIMTEAEAQAYLLEAQMREFERALISVGYSAEEAATIATDGWQRATDEIARVNAEIEAEAKRVADEVEAAAAKSFLEWQKSLSGMTEADILMERYGLTIEQASMAVNASMEMTRDAFLNVAMAAGITEEELMRMVNVLDAHIKAIADAEKTVEPATQSVRSYSAAVDYSAKRLQEAAEVLRKAGDDLSKVTSHNVSMVRKIFDAEIQKYQEIERQWRSVADSISRVLENLLFGNDSPLTRIRRVEFARLSFQGAYAGAMGGDVGAGARAGELAQHYLSVMRESTTDRREYERAFFETAWALKDIEEKAEKQADAAEIMVSFLETMRDDVVSAIENIEYAITNGLITLKDAQAMGFTSVEAFVGSLGGEIDTFVAGLGTNLSVYAGSLYDGLSGANKEVLESLKTQNENLFGALNNGWIDVTDEMKTFFDIEKWVKPINELIPPMKNMESALLDYLKAFNDYVAAGSGGTAGSSGGGTTSLGGGTNTLPEFRAVVALVKYANEAAFLGKTNWTIPRINEWLKTDPWDAVEWANYLVKIGAIPGYASGGHFSGGLMLTGERGPELINASVPGYVHNAQDTRRILSGADGNEIAKLKEELRETNRKLDIIVSNTAASAEALENMDGDGIKMVAGVSI